MVGHHFSPSARGRRVRSARRRIRLAALVLLAVLAVLLTAQPLPAGAQTTSSVALTLSPTPPLSAVSAPLSFRVSGTLGETWGQAQADLVLTGPGAPSSGGQGWPVAFRLTQRVGDLPAEFTISLTLPATALPVAGGYLATVTLTAPGGRTATAQAWAGRLPPAPPTIDLALVLPIALGVHRAPDGSLIGDTLQSAVNPSSDDPRSLYGLFAALDSHAGWHLTLGVEPLLLDAMADMADGYEEQTEAEPRAVPESAPGAQNAAQALETFRRVAAFDGVQIVPGPYALPALDLLAYLDWDDGFDQMRLGRDVVKSRLGQPPVVQGAYAPGLEITTDSMRYFSQSSIDHAVVSADVAGDLAERPDDLSRPVRVRDAENNRLTLLFSNRELRAAVGSPWGPDRFLAALAQEIAVGRKGPFVVAAADDYGPPPGSFLQGVLDTLDGLPWVQSRTVDEIIALYPPSTRPIFLTRYGGFVENFMGRAFVERMERAHALTADLVEASEGSDRAPLDRLRVMLYTGQSRYWFSRGQDPAIANLGLSYLEAVGAFVEAEFGKVEVGSESVLFVGKEGEVPVGITNTAGYPMNVDLVLMAEGLAVRGGDRISVTLGPQENVFSVPVTAAGSGGTLQVKVVAGSSVVDEGEIAVRALSIGSLLPWVLGAVLVLAALVALLLRVRARV